MFLNSTRRTRQYSALLPLPLPLLPAPDDHLDKHDRALLLGVRLPEVAYVVVHSGILGIPNTEHMLRAGELVSEDDFYRVPGLWAKMLRTGAVRVADSAEAAAGLVTRARSIAQD
jgi:hypothetical protein